MTPDRTERLQAAAASAFRRLPRRVRWRVVRAVAPTFTVGAVLVATDAEGRVLLVRQRHSGRWALPGGLLNRGESPATALSRELAEEVSLAIPPALLPAPLANVDPRPRRVDLVYRWVSPLPNPPRAQGPEVLELGWFALSALPDVTGPAAQVIAAAGLRG